MNFFSKTRAPLELQHLEYRQVSLFKRINKLKESTHEMISSWNEFSDSQLLEATVEHQIIGIPDSEGWDIKNYPCWHTSNSNRYLCFCIFVLSLKLRSLWRHYGISHPVTDAYPHSMHIHMEPPIRQAEGYASRQTQENCQSITSVQLNNAHCSKVITHQLCIQEMVSHE